MEEYKKKKIIIDSFKVMHIIKKDEKMMSLFLVLAAHVFFDLTDHIRVREHHIPERIRGI